MAAIGDGEFGGWFGEGRAGGDDGVVEGWGQRLGEVGVATEVGGMESPTPFAEAPPLDFRI